MMLTRNIRGHTILPLLDDGSTVIDCGGNHGDFAEQVFANFGCRATVLEPNPALFSNLKSREHLNALPFALTDQDGPLFLALGADDEASSTVGKPVGETARVEVTGRTLKTLLTDLRAEHVDLLKLDIEGSEIGVLLNTDEATLRRIKQFTVEFHDFCNYVSEEQVQSVLDRLSGLGFEVCRMTQKGNGHGDVLIINSSQVSFAAAKATWIRNVERNARGVWRRVAGMFSN